MHRTEGTYDERSRVLYTVARIEDPYALVNTGQNPLRIGTFVNANIEGKSQSNLVALPRYILRAGNFVWVVDENMQLRNRKLSILRTGGETMYVTAGLENGDLVSLTALDNTFARATVNIVSRTPSNVRKLDENMPAVLPESNRDSSNSTLSDSTQAAAQTQADAG